MPGSFRILLQLFQDRFFENDSGIDFEANIYRVLGLLAIPGLLVAMFLVPHFMELSFRPPGPAVDWALRSDRLIAAGRTASPMTRPSICSLCADVAPCLRESSGRPPASSGSR